MIPRHVAQTEKNWKDFQCIALKDCNRDVASHLRAYKVVDDMVQNEVQLLLTRQVIIDLL